MNGKKNIIVLKGMEVKTCQTDVCILLFSKISDVFGPKIYKYWQAIRGLGQVCIPTKGFSNIRKKAFGTSGLRIKSKVEAGSKLPPTYIS